MKRPPTVLFAAILAASPALAQDLPAPVPPPVEAVPVTVAPPDAFDRARIEAFVDGAVESYRRTDRIAGVTVTVVTKDQVLLSKGYGYAKIDPLAPVDPATTRFRIGSISKTFTYILAMQLAEQGKLDLEADANTYLPDALKIPDMPAFGRVRVLDLMQHTAGFEDSALGHLFVEKGEQSLSSEDYLARFRPKRVRAAGKDAVYSNYGVSLLGALVARVAGQDFDTLVEERILKPLGMGTVTFREPGLKPGDPRGLPDADLALWSDGFAAEAGWFAPKGFEHIAQIGPAGGASASASGMAPYMQMLLNGGSREGATILNPASFAKMAAISTRNAEATGAMAHGFFRSQNGPYESLEHGGATLWFHSNMAVWPDAGLGVFISTNTSSGADLARALPALLLEALKPDARPPAPALPDKTASHPEFRFAGDYLTERRGFSSFEALFLRLGGASSVSAMPDGSIAITARGQTRRLVPDSDTVWRTIDGNDRVVFRDNGASLAGASGVTVSTRIGPLDNDLVFGGTLNLVFLGSLLALFGAWLRWWFATGKGQGGLERVAGWSAFLAAFAWIGAFGVLTAALLPMADQARAVYDYPGPLLPLAQQGLTGAAGLSLLMLPLLFFVWTGRSWSWWRRITHTAYAALSGFAAFLLWHWGAILTPLTIAG